MKSPGCRWWLAAILVLLPAPAWACNVPVFRYALERWVKVDADDMYRLYVFNDGPFTGWLEIELDKLEKRLDPGEFLGPPANVLLYRVDVSRPIADEDIARVWRDREELVRIWRDQGVDNVAPGPWMVLRFPRAWGLEGALDSQPFDIRVINDWLHSPLRQKIANRILLGHSGVFLFVESGDTDRDAKLLADLQTWLARLEKELPLPELKEEDVLLRKDIPYQVSFSVLRLSRTDPVENKLLAMLGAMNPADFADVKQPMLVAIYGRGIAMSGDCLIGKGINEENVGSLARFLLGPCSCEMRRLNPGIELLMTADWEGQPVSEQPVPKCGVGLEKRQQPDPYRWWLSMVVALCTLGVVVLVGTLRLMRGQQPTRSI